MLLSLPLYTSSSGLESTSAIFQEWNPVFLKPSVPKPYHTDLGTSSLGSDSPTLVSFVSSGVVWRDSLMAFISQDIICSASGLTHARDHPQDKDMSDHKVVTDMDSDESNYEGETLQELYSIRSGIATSARTVWTRALVQSVSKATATGRTISSKTPRSRMTNTRKAALAPRKSKSTVKSTATATTANGSLSSRKHDSPGENEESSATKRAQFLKRNRVAAFKCREKKRRQTLTTVTDADIIMARNQALYETFDELQEEARMLKDQILCHRGCSCDAIQKFVQSSFGCGSFMRRTQAPRTMSILQDSLGYRF
ncbi:hypothetical protein EC968_005952 [Mortierella alpina]|nr:hypothetical protein EC968_005952 [Mortierella alpina]